MIAEKISSLKRDGQGNLPLEYELEKAISHPSVSFHVLPLPTKSGAEKPAPKPNKPKAERTRSRTPPRAPQPSNKGKGKGKRAGGKKGRGPNVPKALIGKSLQTQSGERICWPFKMESGCSEARPGEKCSRGLHVCCEPNCQKPHSLLHHK